jgi:hypothetical protein
MNTQDKCIVFDMDKVLHLLASIHITTSLEQRLFLGYLHITIYFCNIDIITLYTLPCYIIS